MQQLQLKTIKKYNTAVTIDDIFPLKSSEHYIQKNIVEMVLMKYFEPENELDNLKQNI